MAAWTEPTVTSGTEPKLRAILDDAVCRDIELGTPLRPGWSRDVIVEPSLHIPSTIYAALIVYRYRSGYRLHVQCSCCCFLQSSTCCLQWDRGQAPCVWHCQVIGVLSVLPKCASPARACLFHARGFRRLNALYPVPEYAHLKRVRKRESGECTIKVVPSQLLPVPPIWSSG